MNKIGKLYFTLTGLPFCLAGSNLIAKTLSIIASLSIVLNVSTISGFVTSPLEFYIAAGFIGLGMGGIQSLSRSTYSKLIDVKYSTSYFSFYDVSQKLSSVLGTAIYATMDLYTGSIRLGILLFALFFIPSIYILTRISKS